MVRRLIRGIGIAIGVLVPTREVEIFPGASNAAMKEILIRSNAELPFVEGTASTRERAGREEGA